MARLSRLIVAFALLFLVLIIGIPFLRNQFSAYPLMKTQDAVDLLTPLILIPVYWLLFQVHPDAKSGPREALVFMVLAALWVEGQGIHLAANSIGHLTGAFAGSNAAALTYFYDEVLSHYMWHAGIIGLSLLLIFRQWRNPFAGMRSTLRAEFGAGILHGLSFGLMALEGATIALGLPSAALVVVFGLARGRGQFRQQPLLAFFFVAYLTAAILFVAWRVYWGCFIEPFDMLQGRGC